MTLHAIGIISVFIFNGKMACNGSIKPVTVYVRVFRRQVYDCESVMHF